MKKIGKFLTVVGQIAAVLLVFALLIQYIDNLYHFIPPVVKGANTTILDFIVKYGVTLVVGLLALGAGLKTNLIITIIIALVIAAVIGFMFYGDAVKSYLPDAKEPETAIAALII